MGVNVVKLGDYIKIQTGKLDANASNENGIYPFFTCAVEPLQINIYAYDCECILVAGNGDLNVKYYNGKFNAYQRTYIIEIKNKELDIRYLYHFLTKYINILRKNSIGGVIKYIKLGDLTDIKLPLPSIDKQQKIVSILDKADEIRTKKKQANEKLDEFLKSTFVDMFGDPVKNEKHYKQIALAEIGKFKNGINFNSDDNGYTIKCIGVGDFKNNIMLNCVNNIKNVELNQQPSEEYFLRKNDIIFVRSNGSKELVGRTLLINTDLSESVVYSGFCIRLRVGRENINNMFLLELLNTKPIKENMKNDGHGCNIKSLNQSILGNIPVILPPIEEQNKFAQIVEKVEEQKQKNEKVIEQMDNLFNSLSQQAFKGEL